MIFSVAAAVQAADKTPVSYKDIVPILRANCQGCHKPDKSKGGLDSSTYSALLKGGKHGVAVKAGDSKSLLLEQVRGATPEMPPDGDALKADQIALLERWIKEGAEDDSASIPITIQAAVYNSLPAVTAMAFSSNGNVLAVAGYREILLHKPDGSGLLARLPCEASRIEAITYSRDGKTLAACGGVPGLFGQVLLWDASTYKPRAHFKLTTDSLFGISLSPDGERIAVGCADRTARVISSQDGKEVVKFDQHTDWVFGTAFTADGKRFISASRDRAMKLIHAENGDLLDDVNKQTEPILCMARHPTEELVVFGTEKGMIRSYKMLDSSKRDEKNDDPNRVKEYDRLPGAVQVICYSADGAFIAAGGMSKEVRVFKSEGGRLSTITGFTGPVYALAFTHDGTQIGVGGMDGKIRIYETKSGKLVKAFPSIPGMASPSDSAAPEISSKPVK